MVVEKNLKKAFIAVWMGNAEFVALNEWEKDYIKKRWELDIGGLMKVNISVELKSLDGQSLMKGNKPMCIRDICIEALLATFDDERNIPGEEKKRRYDIAKRIHENESEFSDNEIDLMKRSIAKAYGPLIVGQSWEILNGN